MLARQCGDCTLCCKLLPVRELGKVAGQRCRHQRHTGCRVYNRPAMPSPCKLWNCAWLTGSTVLGLDAGELRRPDRCHYVVDMLPDYVEIADNASGTRRQIPVLQVWVDPVHPDAHRSPELRAFLARAGERGIAAIIRYSSDRGFVLFPPALAADGEWHEESGTPKAEHSAADVYDVLHRLAGENERV